MNEEQLRGLIAGRKRRFRRALRRMVGLGLSAPFAIAGSCRSGRAGQIRLQAAEGGRRRALRLLYWQAPTLLNPAFCGRYQGSGGLADLLRTARLMGCRRQSGADVRRGDPDIENASRRTACRGDGAQKGVKWHDGEPFTADDVVFNWEYAADPATAATTIGSYQDVKVEKLDPLTVRVGFPKPMPFWADAFIGTQGMIIPKHLFEAYKGAKSRDAQTNLKPVGTGPYALSISTPATSGRTKSRLSSPNRPHFDTIEMKGGGDAVRGACGDPDREYDYA
jgi:peptide/nickel transport system substrate-binding protein